MKRVQLGGLGGKYFTLIDDADYDFVTQWRWTAVQPSSGGIVVMRKGPSPRKKTILLHAELCPGIGDVDHVNMDTLDNRRCNLRRVSRGWNLINRRARKGTSRFKGVSRDTLRNKWSAEVSLRGKRWRLGRFETEEAAAKAYDEKARELFGEFGRYNFPLAGEQHATCS